MSSALLDWVIKHQQEATRLVSMEEAMDAWLERQEGRIDSKRLRRRRSLRQGEHKDVNKGAINA